jgi:hypothetical protein
MTSCNRCTRLLLAYVAAGNQVIELKRLGDAPSGFLAGAMAKRAQARWLLNQYRGNHRCDGHCPNNCRSPRGCFSAPPALGAFQR